MVVVAAMAAAGTIALLRRSRRMAAQKAIEDARTRYGVELASFVADRLERGDVLSYGHRDYCGTGLRFASGEYIYDRVVDGELPSTAELQAWKASPSPERRVFSTRSAFIEWLAHLTDNELSGLEIEPERLANNQRITRHRLLSFARGEPVPWS